jgi:5-methylcytosine-specific restriction protein A
MIKKDLSITSDRDHEAGISHPRSTHWPEVERKFLSEHPVCEVCGTKNKLNVHHKKPFHLFPELELDPTNLITLCMEKECHILIGHGDNFKDYNPNVEEDVAKLKQNINLFEEVAKNAKLHRLSE